MSTPCDRLPAYLDGRLAPDEEAAFERHAVGCDACEAAALPDALGAELRALADVACPSDVVAAALAAAHAAPPPESPAGGRARAGRGGAPDRPALRSQTARRRTLAVAAVLAAVVFAVLAVPGGAERDDAPFAERGGAETEAAPPAAAESLPEATPPEVAQAAPPAPPAARPEPEGGAAPLPDAPVTAPPPADDLVAAVPAEPADDASPDDPSPDDAPTEAEVEAAARDLRLAFALIADAQRQADRALRDEADALGSLGPALPHLTP